MDWPISWEDVKNSLKKKELMYEWNPGVDENGEPVYGVFMIDQFIENNDDWVFNTSNPDNVVIDVEYWPNMHNEITGENTPVDISILGKLYERYTGIVSLDGVNLCVMTDFYGDGAEAHCMEKTSVHIAEDGETPEFRYEGNGWAFQALVNEDGEYAGIKSIRVYKVS